MVATTIATTWAGVRPIALSTATSRDRWRVSSSTVLNTPPIDIPTSTIPSTATTERNSRNEASPDEFPSMDTQAPGPTASWSEDR